MNFRKLGIVIEREYLNKVKKKSFLLITFLTPVLFAGIAILPSLIMMGTKEAAKQVGVVDHSGIVMPYLESGEVLEYKDLGADVDVESIKADLKKADIDILLTISPLDPETKSVTADTYSLKPLGMDSGSGIERRINDAVEAYRIDSYGIDNLEEIMHSVKSNVHVHNYTISESGEESISESGVYMAISMILGMALYMFIALFSGMVMSSVIEEKSSRVVEVLVSSVKATELMFGGFCSRCCCWRWRPVLSARTRCWACCRTILPPRWWPRWPRAWTAQRWSFPPLRTPRPLRLRNLRVCRPLPAPWAT